LQLAANHSVQSTNIHGSPVIVSGTALPPANERSDRLTNACWTVAGARQGSTVRPLDRSTDRHQGRGAVHFLASFIAAARKLLVACCDLQLQKL